MRLNFRGLIFCLVHSLVFVSTDRSQNGTWKTRAPMPVRRQELATGALNGKVYVIGDYDENDNSTATVQVCDPITDTWASAHRRCKGKRGVFVDL
jgi:hypothetical protein